jgi:hypothetical protein
MSLFKKSAINKEIIKRVSLYISDKEQQIIIAPIYRNNAGIYYEQETCTTVKYPLDYVILADEIINHLTLFALKDKNLRDEKLSDWPAYKASKLKSVKTFEKSYLKIEIAGANEANIILVFEGVSLLDHDLTIKSSISLYANKTSIGKLVMKIYSACFGIFNNDSLNKANNQ